MGERFFSLGDKIGPKSNGKEKKIRDSGVFRILNTKHPV